MLLNPNHRVPGHKKVINLPDSCTASPIHKGNFNKSSISMDSPQMSDDQLHDEIALICVETRQTNSLQMVN